MLEWARGGAGVRFALLVHHTDAEREWAYDRVSSAGRLDRAIDVAQAEGWTIVAMKNESWYIEFLKVLGKVGL